MKTHYTDPLHQYAESAWKNLNLEPPVDLRVVCDKLGIILEKELMDNDICGLYVITPERNKVISINLGMPVSRQRFTISHEIGHDLLLPKTPEPGIICKLRCSGNPKTEEERRCDSFGAALLMPHWLVREWFEDLKSNPTGRVPVMANRFGVSLSAMRVRLKELGLQSK